MRFIKSMKSTLKIGFIVAALCLMKEMLKLLVFHLGTEITNTTNSDDNIYSNNAVGIHRCPNANNYLNRRFFFQILMGSDNHLIGDDAVTEAYGDSSGRSREETAGVKRGKQRQCCVHQPTTQLFHREYRKEDVVRCVDSLLAKRNQRPMHIAFVGDSTVRQHYSSFIRRIPDYDRKIESLHTKIAENLYHDDMNLTSHLLGDLKISFSWRNLINEDMLNDFRRWASSIGDHAQVPDLILFGATIHHMMAGNNVTFEMYEKLVENDLAPLMKKSLLVHPHQEIIWLKQSTTIEHIMTLNSAYKPHPDKIKRYNSILPRIFKDTRVVIWDSINAIAEEYIRACALTRYSRRDVRFVHENCNDMIHTGMGAISLGTRLLLNHICCGFA